MKKLLAIVSLIFVAFSVNAKAQADPPGDSFELLLETDAKHNLSVAWQYFKLRKAYVAVLMRTEETIAAHPGFSKMDEVLYLSGMASYYLSEGKGKQKIDLTKMPEDERERYRPEKLREDAVAYLNELVEKFPESKYAKRAKKTLSKISPDG